MTQNAPSTNLETRIADVRDNICDCTEQAATFPGREDEARSAMRIVKQEALLAELRKEREAQSGQAQGPPGPGSSRRR